MRTGQAWSDIFPEQSFSLKRFAVHGLPEPKMVSLWQGNNFKYFQALERSRSSSRGGICWEKPASRLCLAPLGFIHLQNWFPGDLLGVCKGTSASVKATAPGAGGAEVGYPPRDRPREGAGGRRLPSFRAPGEGERRSEIAASCRKRGLEAHGPGAPPGAGTRRPSGRGAARGRPRLQPPEDAEHPPPPPPHPPGREPG